VRSRHHFLVIRTRVAGSGASDNVYCSLSAAIAFVQQRVNRESFGDHASACITAFRRIWNGGQPRSPGHAPWPGRPEFGQHGKDAIGLGARDAVEAECESERT
jgi:hypothetical protein